MGLWLMLPLQGLKSIGTVQCVNLLLLIYKKMNGILNIDYNISGCPVSAQQIMTLNTDHQCIDRYNLMCQLIATY